MTNYHEDFLKNFHQIYSLEATKILSTNFWGSRKFLTHWWSYLNRTIWPYFCENMAVWYGPVPYQLCEG
jgi:hypothetical protein